MITKINFDIDGNEYVTRAKATVILGRHLYGEDRKISLKMLNNLVKEDRLKELKIAPSLGGRIPRYFISKSSIIKFLEGN